MAIRLTVEVMAPMEQAIGIKEQICMELEKFGDVKVVAIEQTNRRRWEQARIDGKK